ncbi:SDR family oxidoreductase [Lujinxingia vulgaris]|uniref:SDR family oxidoreductase n=1 Tax=Lujinxingia vulgaris TaxID=2600176 RepID=A0A5C6X9G7_9DELT|nr:SDR family oxidoreductase [Lujinxingia vulgaris]TXD35834.1 SDR family oxidoreductase [Lujinxingia vulgaris]
MKQRTRRPRKERVLITGIGGNLGRAVARRLHRRFEVVGIDRRAVRHMPKDVDIEQVDIRRRRVEDVFRRQRLDAVVHLNIMHDPRSRQDEHHQFNIVGTQKIFELCAEHRVPKVVVLSSADVYGPDPRNDQFLKEDAALMGGQKFEAIRDLIALDMFCNTFFWRHPEIETVILRPVHIVGRVNNAPSRYLRLERPPTIMGFDPMVQLIHVEDVVSAIEKALTPGIRGVFNLAGPSPVPLSFILERLGREPRPMPEPLLKMMLSTAWSLKISDWPVPELDHIKYVCMVDDGLARNQLGFAPSHDLESILHELRPGHRP